MRLWHGTGLHLRDDIERSGLRAPAFMTENRISACRYAMNRACARLEQSGAAPGTTVIGLLVELEVEPATLVADHEAVVGAGVWEEAQWISRRGVPPSAIVSFCELTIEECERGTEMWVDSLKAARHMDGARAERELPFVRRSSRRVRRALVYRARRLAKRG